MPEDQNLADGEAVAADVPEWVPEKFRSNPEKFAEAYTNLEREFHATKQQAKSIEQNYNELSARVDQMQQPAEPAYDPNDIAAQYGVEPEALQLMVQLAQAAAQNSVQQYQQQQAPNQQSQAELVAAYASTEVQKKYEDFGQYRDKIAETFSSQPYLWPEQANTSPQEAVKAIETAYQLVKAQDLFAGAAEQQTTAADLMQRMKLQAQTAQGADGRPSPADDGSSRWEEITNAKVVKYEDLFR